MINENELLRAQLIQCTTAMREAMTLIVSVNRDTEDHHLQRAAEVLSTARGQAVNDETDWGDTIQCLEALTGQNQAWAKRCNRAEDECERLKAKLSDLSTIEKFRAGEWQTAKQEGEKLGRELARAVAQVYKAEAQRDEAFKQLAKAEDRAKAAENRIFAARSALE